MPRTTDRPRPLTSPIDVELDIDTAGRHEIVEALVRVGCGRAAARALADSLAADSPDA
ncbi:hypothetical protein [Dermatobacter hominis]|uniref:hypothetical protein n=1 Tax=Dermatobacter hominis TaxID=2884263 RepID=UPI001D108372|nr:hypothetical protein [Dermatobacter hominis]UDY35707.1 hypothetical protein LH044_20575 [Dermatobacter hominis]